MVPLVIPEWTPLGKSLTLGIQDILFNIKNNRLISVNNKDTLMEPMEEEEVMVVMQVRILLLTMKFSGKLLIYLV